ncbi:MAG: polyprenyl diphosphate synthase [Burkholderiaceae bacterium]
MNLPHFPESAHLQAPSVPRHVAIVMDGNGRWAQRRHLPRVAGHAKGVDAVRRTVEASVRAGIEYLTLFAFSSENWRRPVEEVSVLMRLFMTALEREIVQLRANNIRLRVVGDLSRFDPKLCRLIEQAQSRTAQNDGLVLTIAANYGGRWDILNAVQTLHRAHPERIGSDEPLHEDDLAPYLALAYAPEPDLFIRTGGEQRISNFMLWQLAYTEFYFTDAYWPDFGADALAAALSDYRSRERRFGRTGAQVSGT